MIPRILIDTAPLPGGGALRLYRRGDEYAILLGGIELMTSRAAGSEEALARIACERIAGRPRPQLLIGGLGMGFTLRAALALLPPDAAVTVAELVPAVVAWARGPLAHLHGASLDDPRVTVRAEDVACTLPRARWDAILLDVDNGPGGFSIPENDRLYAAPGLAAARAALKPGGLLAIWSSHPDAAFTRRLRAARFQVEELPVRSAGRKGARHHLWFARAAGGGGGPPA
jgi:spermidine synthase